MRAQLKARVQRDLDDDHLESDVYAEQLQMRGGMIDEGTAPKPAHFARFEPVMNADGSIRALRFVFPPYQVAPYVEGTQTVDVPAKIVLPLVAPAYRPLFRAG
ncbi:RsiV family protein [Thermomonas sp. S9]|uniref:RsiV family protein n=1 Tax=Thermomonas sp. S9 TaxID=2885203 RepID=UPI00216AD17F|nr:RsiV family protein [Thermomonas sp. S9]MCR6496679.1 RsiV family protein [Thermomonas sp. S9]